MTPRLRWSRLTPHERELAQAVVFLEDQIADLRILFRTLPRDEFGSAQMDRILGCLRGVAIDTTALFLAANTIASETKETPNAAH